jgi:hypothetical protein
MRMCESGVHLPAPEFRDLSVGDIFEFCPTPISSVRVHSSLAAYVTHQAHLAVRLELRGKLSPD